MFRLKRYEMIRMISESRCCMPQNPLAVLIRYITSQIVHFAVYFIVKRMITHPS